MKKLLFLCLLFAWAGLKAQTTPPPAQPEPQLIQLYSGRPAGSEAWDWTEKEMFSNIFNTQVVYNVSQPTLTAYLPHPLAANGTAVIIAPGGGFQTLSINSEGIDVARWLNARGVAAFVLKYRLAHSLTDDPVRELMGKMQGGGDLSGEPVIPMAIADGREAIRYVREHAAEFKIDPKRIGFMGFSAGGTVTMGQAFGYDAATRPDFLAPVYAYMGAFSESQMALQPDAPPIFIAAASDDQLGLAPHSVQIYQNWLKAGKSAELVMYQKGGHGFGMRPNNNPSDTWIERFGDWMKFQGLLPAPPPPPNMFSRIPTPNDTLQSTRVLPDGRVRLSIYAREAAEVSVSGDFPGGFPRVMLKKSPNGVWSYTSDKAWPADVYTYDFTVDGVRTFDPRNRQYKESNAALSNIFEVPGAEADFMQVKNVPHGRVEAVNYFSSSLGQARRLHIYLPPGYDKLKKLPVLYLLHGGGDNDASWTTVGKANLILDNLLAEGKIRPMVVVMPAGHVPGAAIGAAMGAGPANDPFAKDLLQDILPLVEKSYKVSPKREHRAIAGLSMGGAQTLNIALWNPELFAYVFPLSTGFFPPVLQEIESKHAGVLKNPAVNTFRNFTVFAGKDDALVAQNNKNTLAWLDKNGVKHQYVETEGSHTFLVWRRNLRDFAQMLWK